ncbi:MAG: hypothetical protein H6733_15545 [Alphaproteobacteria bacterium]|nr:hypothetical protein [Alphaproteobacteria bacterium]
MHRPFALLAAVACVGCGTPSSDDADTDTVATGDAPMVITDQVSPVDDCTLVILDTDAWGSLTARFHDDANPYTELSDNEDGFDFTFEMYPDQGSGWVGEVGVFPTNCETHGLCATFCPGGGPCLEANGRGKADIQRYLVNNDVLEWPVQIVLSNLTFRGNGATCYHVDEVDLHMP